MAETVSMDHSSGVPVTQGSREVAAKAGAMERPEYYLELAEGSMEAVQKMSSSLKFNNEQCKYLADKLKVVVKKGSSFLRKVDERCSSDDRSGLAEIFKLLVALGKQVESFVEGCCKDAWIQAAMTLTNVSQYVSSLGFNLELCRVAFRVDFAVSGLLSSDEVADINKTEADIVEKKASADRDLLLEKVKVTQTVISSQGEDQDLASSLLRRLMRFGGTFEDEPSLSKLFALVEPAEQVGRGSSATVYKARWLGTWVAKKTFKGSENDDFDEEVKILSRLCHPNVTSMFCCAKERLNCSIIMELMDGDLDHLMERRCNGSGDSDCAPFPILEAVDIMDQIGEGVKYLHSQGIVHRDLKSLNILYKKVKAGNLDIGYAHVKVTDFGVSKSRDKSVTNSDMSFNVGTSRWMPPEVIKLAMGSSQTWWFRKIEKAPRYPFKVDTYSFGMVCYEILTGHRPFYDNRSERDVKRRVSEDGDRPKLPDECPLKLKTLIEKCWSQKPTERPTFAEICGELKYLKYLLISVHLSGKTLESLDCSRTVQGATPVSDSVFRFYQPQVPVQLEVVFVHGLVDDNSGDAYWKTWLARDGTPNNVWPMTWLSAEFPFAQVYALRYDASIKQTATDGRMGLFLVGENLVQEMVNYGRIGQNGVPVVFVCHGFGCLVAKQIVVSAKNRFSQDRKAQNLLQNIRGFNFYSIPRRGSVLAKEIHNAKRGGKGSRLENMEVLNTEISRLSEAFEKVKRPSWYIASAAETHASSQDKQMVVGEASSRYEDGNYLPLSENYYDIVRPKAKNDSSYLWLTDWLREIVRRFEVSLTVREESLVPERFVGLQEQEEAIRRLLQEASIVGVVGMGGIGKTTLAKAVYQSICKDFDRSSYLDDVKSKASLDEVLVTLLQDFKIIDRTGSIVQLSALKDSKDVLLEDLKKYVQQHKVLVVVDDVGTKENFDRLLKDMGFLAGNKESRLIVTCRNWQVLKEYAPLVRKYDLEFLSSGEDIELFSYHAFQGATNVEEKLGTLQDFLLKDSSEHLMDEFEIVCGDVVRACSGLPLSLEVMGRFLGGYLKDDLSSEQCLDCWKGASEKLKNAEPMEGGDDNDKLWKVLQISYDALRENEQNMFLDVACFFSESVQYSEQTLIWIWGGKQSKLIGLRNLKERCLVKINREDGVVTMHDQLRDMGRGVVRGQARLKGKKMNRLWDCKDVRELLQSNEIKSAQIEGLSLYGLSLKDGSTSWNDGMGGEPIKTLKQKNFNLNCPEMRLLNLLKGDENVIDAINIEGTSSVQWLCLSESSISEVPIFLQQCKELCVLDMRGCEWLEKLPNTIGILSSLLELNLCGCISLQRLPDSIGDLVKLSKLDLSYCEGLTCLPESIGKLSNLLELNLCGCISLQWLPESIGDLVKLSKLGLSYCEGLTCLPRSIGKLSNLLELNLCGCISLQWLPESIGDLVKLSKLVLSYCEGLACLPMSIGKLSNLLELNLYGCNGLTRLPESIGDLVKLSKLDLSYCEGLTCLPMSIGKLSNLLELNLCGCISLQWLPDSIGDLMKLSKLVLSFCEGLTCLPESIGKLSNLLELDLCGCNGLTRLPESIGELVKLSKLDLSQCKNLARLSESIGNLSNLLELDLCGCKGLTRLPDTLGNLTKLQKLAVHWCKNLVELPQSAGRLSQLSGFDLSGCHKWEWKKASQISLLHELQQHGCSEIRLPDKRPYHGKYSTEYCSSGTAICDGCGLKPISIKCWHCDICPQFDLCESCYERRHELDQLRRQSEHVEDHPMTAITVL